MRISDALLLGGLGFIGWKIFETVSDTQSEEQGRPALWPMVVDAANAANIPPAVLGGVVAAESSWSNKPNRHSADCKVGCIASGVCAIGLAQVLPSTAADVGVTGDLCDPRNNLLAGARYLRKLYSKYGNWPAALAAYNWGPGNVDRALKDGRSFYSGSVAYADKVLAAASRYGGSALSGLAFMARPSLFRLTST